MTAAVAARRDAGGRVAPVAASPLRPPTWLLRFVYIEIACQVALLLPSVAASRVAMRSAAFASSLLLTFLLPGPRENHPSRLVGTLALAVIGVSIFHPTTNTILAGVATLGLNLAILGPIFWVPRMRIDIATLRRLFFAFWAFHTASASVGVLQVYFPGRFQPATATNLDESYIQGLQITLQSGAQVLRPMGLTDTPGGAGQAAIYAILFACVFLLDRPRIIFRCALLASMCVGCFTLYICQVRVNIIMLVIALLAMAIPFISCKRFGDFLKVATPLLVIAVASFSLALTIGADAVTSRLSTLFDDSPGKVYYSNRGIFLEYTLTDLVPRYPLGAGLGRWGMMRTYFGDPFNVQSPPMWAEIQWTGWLLDGGIPLMILYAVAILLAIRESLRISLRREGPHEELGKWAAVLTGYSVSVAAATFGFCPFSSTLGVDFWLLNATVFAASRQMSGRPT